jgi:sterol desaturase/sphingolipid hydroxylase (fatty acid hydroxylase superfamily)
MIVGMGGAGTILVWRHPPLMHLYLGGLLTLAIALTFVAEKIVPYNAAWNSSHGDFVRDTLHAIVNEGSIVLSVLAVPLLVSLLPFRSYWPRVWPFGLQVCLAVLVIDFGISITHYFSHRYRWLWRFHAVHHSVKRMYGFNGLMKHPIHQAIEMTAGTLPLILMGLPAPIALAAAYLVAVQLLTQHANVDMRLGPLKYLIAAAEGHRFHHQKWPKIGDVNFGLFTLLWDHALGTFYYEERRTFASDELGIGAQPDYPPGYFAQLAQPFRPYPSAGQPPIPVEGIR